MGHPRLHTNSIATKNNSLFQFTHAERPHCRVMLSVCHIWEILKSELLMLLTAQFASSCSMNFKAKCFQNGWTYSFANGRNLLIALNVVCVRYLSNQRNWLKVSVTKSLPSHLIEHTLKSLARTNSTLYLCTRLIFVNEASYTHTVIGTSLN